jgi:hypothetical protein
LLRRKFMTIVAVCVSLMSIACPSPKDRVRSLGPEVQADLVIFFNHDATHQQIAEFWRVSLSKPEVEGRGHDLRDGISQIANINAVQGHEGISVSFFPNATQAQKEAVEKDVRSSSLVYRILKDTAPTDVKKIE